MERQTIKAWAEEDRPREKLLLKGKHALSDAELIAILLGSGSVNETAVELSKHILSTVNQNLHQLGRLNAKELMQFKGIGEAKALTIIAALELGRRRKETGEPDTGKITRSSDAATIFIPMIGDLLHEEFWILFLNRGNRIVGKQQISTGGMSGTVADPKMIFKAALDQRAHGIILCHNHPSGNPKPSESDIRLTKNLADAGKMLEISVLDHVIVTTQGFYSFADEGMM